MTGVFFRDFAEEIFWKSGVQSDSFQEFYFGQHAQLQGAFFLFQLHDGMAWLAVFGHA